MLSTTRHIEILSSLVDSPQTSTTKVSDGFPSVLDGPLLWEGKDFASDPGQYIYELSQEEIGELEKAIIYFKSKLFSSPFCHEGNDRNVGTNLARGFLSTLNFSLSKDMVTRLKEVNEIIYNSRGFVILRGIDSRKYDE